MNNSIDIINKNMLKRYDTIVLVNVYKNQQQYIIDVVQRLKESTSITRDIPTCNLCAHSHGLDCLYIEIACQKNANSSRFLKVICKKKHTMRMRKMSSTK